MVLQQAARLTDDPVTRFAALVHDLGKGLTPEEQWGVDAALLTVLGLS